VLAIGRFSEWKWRIVNMDLDTVSELGRIVFGIEWALGIHIYFKDGTATYFD
jgi:hypothetical protein